MAHEYPVTVTWNGGREGRGELTLNNGNSLTLGVDKELGGTGEGTNPEELVTAAVASCYAITFGILAGNRKMPIENFEVKCTGVLEGASSSLKFISILIEPTIIVSGLSNELKDQVETTAHKAEQYCLISNALRGNVEFTVKPIIEGV